MVLADTEGIQSELIGQDAFVNDVAECLGLGEEIAAGVDRDVAEGVEAEGDRRRSHAPSDVAGGGGVSQGLVEGERVWWRAVRFLRLAGVVLAIAVASSAVATEPAAVAVRVMVTDKAGRFVDGLTTANFAITDNGKKQTILSARLDTPI
jgi:hypothetical protein